MLNTALVVAAKIAAVISATHHGANARTVTGNAIVAVERYKMSAVLLVEFPAARSR